MACDSIQLPLLPFSEVFSQLPDSIGHVRSLWRDTHQMLMKTPFLLKFIAGQSCGYFMNTLLLSRKGSTDSSVLQADHGVLGRPVQVRVMDAENSNAKEWRGSGAWR